MATSETIKGRDEVYMFLLGHKIVGRGTIVNDMLAGARKAILLDGILLVSPAIARLLDDPDEQILSSLEIEIMWSHPSVVKPQIQIMLHEAEEMLLNQQIMLAQEPDNFAYQLSVQSWQGRVDELARLFADWKQKNGSSERT